MIARQVVSIALVAAACGGPERPDRAGLPASPAEPAGDEPGATTAEKPVQPAPDRPVRRPQMVAFDSAVSWLGRDGGAKAEAPRHRVQLSRFAIDRHEVTVGEYSLCVRAGRCSWLPQADRPYGETKCNEDFADRVNYPMNCVTWDQAWAYCRWRGRGLPTEAEWERAASGGGFRGFPWKDRYRCFDKLPTQRMHPVCTDSGCDSPEGICDLGGNVAEWVYDGPWRYPASSPDNPAGSTSETDLRGVRGAAFNEQGASARVTARRALSRNSAGAGVGFRCASGSAVDHWVNDEIRRSYLEAPDGPVPFELCLSSNDARRLSVESLLQCARSACSTPDHDSAGALAAELLWRLPATLTGGDRQRAAAAADLCRANSIPTGTAGLRFAQP